MSNTAEIFLKVDTELKNINVKCFLKIDEEINSFSFSLSTLMKIDSVTSNAQIQWEIQKEWQPQ